MAQTFRTALLRALEQTGVSLKQVCESSGVSYEQFKKVKQGKSQSTNVDDALRVANYFGLTLDEFLADDTAVVREEILDLYRQLEPGERWFLLASARGMIEHPGLPSDKSREERPAG